MTVNRISVCCILEVLNSGNRSYNVRRTAGGVKYLGTCVGREEKVVSATVFKQVSGDETTGEADDETTPAVEDEAEELKQEETDEENT